MAEPIMAEPPPAPDQNPKFSFELDSLPILPVDSLLLPWSDQAPNESLASDLGFALDENGEFELTFDGLDDLYLPAENEQFLIPSAAKQEHFGNFTPESEGSRVSVDRVMEDVDKYLNCWSSESGSCNRESPQESGDLCSGAEGSLNVPSPVSSQGSENCGSGVSEAMHASSAEGNLVDDQKVKVKETGSDSVTKRKKENEDTSGDSRSSKYHRSSGNAAGSAATSEEEEKRRARLMRNRESAQLSRQRKKHHIEELEEKVRAMYSTIAELNSKISYFMAENATLKQRLVGGAGMCPPAHLPPPPGMYPPMAPMPYPWMPCPPFVVKAQGSQVPLIPIPRLKTQQPVSASKAKKSESKKSEGKTKKVASISFLGLLFFIFLFGGLAPIVNVKYGGISDSFHNEYRSNYITDRHYEERRGRVLAINGHLNESDGGSGIGFSNNRVHRERGCDEGSLRTMSGTDKSLPMGNASEPLVASLFVPRNEKLVKIDGNLIIHSVLASEKAMASRKASETSKARETGLVIPKDFSPALPIPDVGRSGEMAKHLYRTNNEQQRALSSGSTDNLKDHFKSTAADGKLHQWFREGVAGPMLSSGMCTEVFQFDVSPAPGAIVPASSATNFSAEHRRKTTHINRGKNRRILNGLPVPLPGSDLNITREERNSSQKENLRENKPGSSMVVSVLVDPREGGDGDIDGMVAPKSLSRIFVVVLLDSVKYVTYSCVLPRSGGPHLVTT